MTLLLVNTSWIINCSPLQYNNNGFPILSTDRSFRLSALKATFIKTLQPNLCQQKEFVHTLDFDWPFSHPMKLSNSFNDARRYINSVWLL